MRGEFGFGNSDSNDKKENGDLLKSPEKRVEGDEEDLDDNDHQKFFKKMQECFSSNNNMKRRKSKGKKQLGKNDNAED